MIRLNNLSKVFGKLAAVNRLNLRVHRGEIFGFIGPNGAGKTTTIRMIAGLLAPSEGSVTIDGIDMEKHPAAAKKKIGLIPDRPYLYEKLTGMEFLKFTGDLYSVDNDNFGKKATELLDLFSLTGRDQELIESYSHGMKQRLVMSAALIHSPPLIVVDEPMVGLDPRGIEMVKTLFRKLAANGTTIFMSTHTLKLAEDLCDRFGIIVGGNMIAYGSLDDLNRASHMGNANLDQIFFQLTDEDGS